MKGQKPNLDLGRELLQWREKAKLTRRALQALAGIDHTYIYKIEKKGLIPSRDVLGKLFHVLEVGETDVNRWSVVLGLSRASDSGGESRDLPTVPVAVTTLDSFSPDPTGGQLRAYLRNLRGRSDADLQSLEGLLFGIAARVSKHWERAPVISYIPEHGPAHSLRMTQILCETFAHELRGLSLEELRVLLACVWLHDIGLALRDSEVGDLMDQQRLETYHTLSAQFLARYPLELGLSLEPEQRAATNLCLHHRNVKALQALDIDNRQKAMLALLRLSDLMSVSSSRIRGPELVTYKPIPRDIASDVIRNLFVTNIYRDSKNCMLVAQVVRDSEWGEVKLKLLSAGIQQDLQAALDRIWPILVVDMRTNLFFASVQTVPVPKNANPLHLRQMLDALGTASSPNAARVFVSLVAALEAQVRNPTVGDLEARVRQELRQYCELRPYHAQIANLREEIDDACVASADESPARIVGVIASIVERYKAQQKAAYETIAREAEKAFEAVGRFVLFGYSNCVLIALQRLVSTHSGSEIIVCECRNKTRYSEVGPAIEYCDGVEYARRVHELGYRSITIVSDASVSFYMRSDDPFGGPITTHVLLGADGIDPTGDVSATVGSTTIAAAAKACGAKVFVLAEGGKVRPIKWSDAELRKNDWLATDDRVTYTLRSEGILIGTPPNERLPTCLIDSFITEKGLLKPSTFAKLYAVKKR